jgi:D-alanyl-lipoteichoic acid acyltransferase DltB (MBOAT superfamily)
LVGLGLLKKVAIATTWPYNLVDRVFDAPPILAVLGARVLRGGARLRRADYYCDFSGYTDIAIGVAL